LPALQRKALASLPATPMVQDISHVWTWVTMPIAVAAVIAGAGETVSAAEGVLVGGMYAAALELVVPDV